MDRSGPITQYLYGRGFRPSIGRAVPAGLGARAEDHLLPSDDGRDPCREIHHPDRTAERGAERRRGIRWPRVRPEAWPDGVFRVRGVPVTTAPPQKRQPQERRAMLSWNEMTVSTGPDRARAAFDPGHTLADQAQPGVPRAPDAAPGGPPKGRVRAEDK